MFRLKAYDIYEKLNMVFIGPFYRSLGKKLYAMGALMQGELYSDDRCFFIFFNYCCFAKFFNKISGSKFEIINTQGSTTSTI